jgi:alpha-glucosidase
MARIITRREILRNIAAGSGLVFSQTTPIQIAGRPVEISLTPVSSQTVRITIQAIENGHVPALPIDGALVKEYWGKPAARLRTVNSRTIKCGELAVKISSNPLTIRIEGKGGRLVQELTSDATTGSLSFQTGQSPLLGLGQGGPQFDRRGKVDRMGSGQGGYQLATHGGKVPIQFLIGTSGWAMFIHQPLGAFDLTGAKGVFQPGNPQASLPLDVFVIGANEPAAILGEYAKITGYPEMVPLWSLGYQQSYRTLGPADEIVAEAKQFRDKKLPCEAMIYLGTDFCPNGWNTHNGEFTWNPKAFPDPKRTMDELHALHFKVVLHVVLEGHLLTGTVADPCTAAPLPSGRTPDNHWPPDRQVGCYWPVHKPLLDLGLDGWWPDQGDGLDAPSRLARNRMYFDGQQMYRPNERVYALHRNAYAGMQRYAAFLWSGDVQSRWETLKNHVPIGINSGLSGIPYWGSDIGGFVPTQDYTGELYVRWFQFAAFTPLFRSWNTGEIVYPETPNYHPDPSELHNAAIEPICKKYLELRYQMMPYLYSAVRETCETGVPIIRALWLHYPADAAAVSRGDEYLYGRDILVAPVVDKGATSRSLYLPHGTWYDFWTQEKTEGGSEINRKVDLETIPLYVRAGAVIPMGPVKQYTDEAIDGPVTLWVHPGADGTLSLYEDDGKTFDYREHEFMRVNIAWNDKQRRLSMRLAKGSKMLAPMKRNIVVRAAGETVHREVVFDGSPTEVKL